MTGRLFRERVYARYTMDLESLRTERRAVGAPGKTLDLSSEALVWSRFTLGILQAAPRHAMQYLCHHLGPTMAPR
jgi:hypothetical protein